MSVLTADKWLVAMFCKELLNIGNGSVHLTFHITGSVVTSIPENTLIMNKTGWICLMEVLVHFKNILTATGLITAGPNDDRRMILVTL